MGAGHQRREAAFEPLAALLLQPEAPRHLDAANGAAPHGATNPDEGEAQDNSLLVIPSPANASRVAGAEAMRVWLAIM